MRTAWLALVIAVVVAANGSALAQGAANVFADALDAAQQRCVKIYGAAAGQEAGYATGIVVSPDGLILTAQGIYLAGSQIRVVTPDGQTHIAQLVRRSEPLQSALLKIDAKTPQYFTLPKQLTAQAGDWVLSVTNLFKVADGKEELSVNLGVLSLRTPIEARHRAAEVPYEGDVLLVDAITSNPGAPGGALIDVEGRLVGMVGKLLVSKNTNTRINYAVPGDLLYKFVHEQTADVAATRPDPANKGQVGFLGIRPFLLGGKRSPAYVDRVVPGSPAAAAGLKRDDLIMSIDGESIKDLREFEAALARLRVGRETTLVVKRKQEVLQVKLVPVAEPGK